ncbi:Do family serine endopeptidase [Chelativorans sp. AA-79]|uniref:Do family serine endopeptidase n=1 Tax=Chelativorans sp. AA-79 TaxID=3028735 RepID=UPI0023F89C70|nr:Do family serine endopeptidase [Chelativorans sp. AA-79]WEX10636.1 Do family serine endopeptidase [Chelativorans sp. AA-79]
MMSRIPRGTLALAAVALAAAIPVSATAQDVPNDFTGIVERMTPAVVAITASRPAGEQQQLQELLPSPFGTPRGPQRRTPRGSTALGSGFAISEQGHIVTNNHVIQGANEIEVLLSDGTEHGAELVGADPATDLAVLKIDPPEGLTVAEWGDSSALQPGAWTIAIGSPFGLGGTVTVGVLSARSRDIRSGPYDNFLQTDASINRGNSGGPLFNAAGRVVGVNTAIFSPVGANIGIGFAVPSSTAQDVVSQLIETGEVERGFIGVSLQPITQPMAQALGLESTEGALIAEVEPGSPAAEAGLKAGDVIVSLNDEQVEDPRELSRAVGQRDPGETVNLSVRRDGEEVGVELTLASREQPQTTAGAQQPGGQDDEARMGLSVSGIPELVRRELDLENGQGVMVQGVEPGSPAAEAGIRQGDVIIEAGGDPAREAADLSEAWREARQDQRPMLLRIARGDTSLFVAVEPTQG